MFIGCIPAHGAYFTIYEGAKPHLARLALPFLSARRGGGAGGGPAGGGASAAAESAQALAAGGAVALGTIAHDLIMTPMDVCKQRMQLSAGGSPGVYACACTILQQEGARAFWLSYPTTLLMNLPYALLMGSANERLRQLFAPDGDPSMGAYFAAGAGAGALAGGLTNPLDVVKTRLQT